MDNQKCQNKKTAKLFHIIQSCFFIMFFIMFFILFNHLYIQYIQRNKIEIISGEEYAEREDYVFTPAFTTENDYIEQSIQLNNVYLESIKIRLMLSGDTEGYMLRLTFCENGNIIKEQNITQHDFVDWSYYEFLIEEKVSNTKNYSLRIQQIPINNNQMDGETYFCSYVVSNAAEHVKENSPYYIYNGEQHDGEFELIYSYNYADNNLIMLLILLDLFVLCFFVFSLKKLRHMNNPTANKIFAIFFYWFTPLITFCIVECLTGNIRNFTFEYYLKNLVIYYLIYYLLLLILRNLKIVTFGYMTIFVVLGLVYYFVLLFRGRPFMIQDIFSLSTAMTVAGTYHYELPAKEFVVLMLYLCLCIFLFNIETNKYKFPKIQKIFISNTCVLGVFLFTFHYYNGILSQLNQWDLQYNYSQMGMVVTLISEIPYLKADKPQNYNTKTVNEIANNIAYVDNVKKDTTPQNIILIMNESFADLDYINKIDTGTELLPYWKNLRENTISGYLNMPVFGSGTSNSEYEVLTGNSIQFLSPGVTAYQMNVKDNAYSLVSILKRQDFHSIAFHPYMAENWNRINVYKYFGFEHFYSSENCWIENTKFLRFFLSDTGTYEELIKRYEESTTNLFEFCITMQNHGGYDDANYVSTVRLNYDKDYPAAEQYLSILQESDLAFNQLINYFSNQDETTMIVMFGDHQPSLETEFYEELYGKALTELSFEESQMLYVTPFIIWTNYDIEEKTNVRMSSNYLGSYILQTAGLNMSDYNRFLLNVYEEIPIIGTGGICDKYGTWYTWNEMPEQYQNLINEYKIIQYNNVYDSKHRLDAFFEVK